ncbi:hypothetical protein CRM22_005939 [Opisthorchis felineus]|uniref:Uncharacterized protein n=1 Tax=Opisthorchis felineus TaxID=147828 RepID=A0A4S2LW07_OPIFE|nr:hypothetical protein CRM22_005939 [Opisthorchis felineus]
MTGATANNVCMWTCFPDDVKSLNARHHPSVIVEPITNNNASRNRQTGFRPSDNLRKKVDSDPIGKSRGCSVRTNRPPWNSYLKPVKASTSTSSTENAGCRLRDLCAEDRSKLARLVYELAIAQQAQEAGDSEPNAKDFAIDEVKKDETVEQEVNVSRQSVQSISPEIQECTKTVTCNYGELARSFDNYRVELSRIEDELNQLRYRLPRDTQPTSKPALQIKCEVSEAAIQPVKESSFERSSHEEAHPVVSKAVQAYEQLTSLSDRIKPQLTDSTKHDQEEFMRERSALQRQQRIISVVSGQQEQLQQLSSRVQLLSSMVLGSNTKTHQTASGAQSEVPVAPNDPVTSRLSQHQQTWHTYTSTLLPSEESPKSAFNPCAHALCVKYDISPENGRLNQEQPRSYCPRTRIRDSDIGTQTEVDINNTNRANLNLIALDTPHQHFRFTPAQKFSSSINLTSVATQTIVEMNSGLNHCTRNIRKAHHLEPVNESLRRPRKPKQTRSRLRCGDSSVTLTDKKTKQTNPLDEKSSLFGHRKQVFEGGSCSPNTDKGSKNLPRSTKLTVTAESLEELQNVLSILNTLDLPICGSLNQPSKFLKLQTPFSPKSTERSFRPSVEYSQPQTNRTNITTDPEEDQLLNDLFFSVY